MAQVSVTIGGRVYRLACGEGEEARIEALAQLVDVKTAEIRAAFGEIGDQRIAVMAALTFADELGEATRKLEEVQAAHAVAQATLGQAAGVAQADALGLADAINDAALRVEQIVHGMGAPTHSRAKS